MARFRFSDRRGGLGRSLVRAGALAVVVLMSGCSSGPEIARGAYAGPRLRVDSTGERHVVVAESPSPGWDVTLDHRRRAPDTTRVFLTLERPNPAAVYPMVIVEQRVRTAVRTGEPIAVYARVLDFGDEDGAPYRPVEQK